jgi:hypothetical protein
MTLSMRAEHQRSRRALDHASLTPRLQAGLRGHREQAAWFALSVWALAGLGQDEEPERTRRETGGRGGLGTVSHV